MAPSHNSVEREVKLSAQPAFILPDLGDEESGLSHEMLTERTLTAIYWDTADLRLTRSGNSLRHRSSTDGAENGWTVKLAEDGAGPVLSRREVTFDGAPGHPPVPAVSLVRAVARGASLVPVGKLVTRRRRSHVLDGDGRPVLEIDDDEVSVYEGRRVASRFREVEVELDPGAGADTTLLDGVVKRLRVAGAGRPDPTPKIVRALGARALAPPEVVAPQVDAKSTIGDVIRAAIANGVGRWLHHDPGVRLGDDDEDVHQARVATRRLRSDLRTFASLLDPTWLAGVRDELAWAGNELGRVRDADVLYGRLRGQAGALPAADTRASATVLRKLSAEREVARSELLAAMDTPRYVALLDRLVQAAVAVPFGPDADPERPAVDVLPGLVLRPWRHLAKAVGGLGADPPDAALHEVRKRAKKARYAAEAAIAVVGKDARRLARAVAGVQEVLGELQDAVVAEQWLRSLSTHGASAERAFVAGQLCAMQQGLIDAARVAWRPAWTAADAKKLRSWLA